MVEFIPLFFLGSRRYEKPAIARFARDTPKQRPRRAPASSSGRRGYRRAPLPDDFAPRTTRSNPRGQCPRSQGTRVRVS